MGVDLLHAVPFHLGSASQYSNQVPSIFSEMEIVGEYWQDKLAQEEPSVEPFSEREGNIS